MSGEEGDRDLQAIEDLSQKLESIFKEIEQIRRENKLFESYLSKHKPTNIEEDTEEKRLKKLKKDKGIPEKKSQSLTPEEKFEIAQYESERLKGLIEESRMQSETALETLKAILQETDMSIAEIRKDAYDFQREILMGGENSRTGKIEAQRIEKYFEEKMKQKENLIRKYKAKIETLNTSIKKTEKQIEKKEVQGDELKFIDYHQLQIENKKYVKEIEEKNQRLLSLKIISGKISAELLRKKKELTEKMQEIEDANTRIEETSHSIEKSEKHMLELAREKDRDYQRRKTLQAQSDVLTTSKDKIPDNMNYVELKKKEEELLELKKNYERKITIAKGIYEKARKGLSHGL